MRPQRAWLLLECDRPRRFAICLDFDPFCDTQGIFTLIAGTDAQFHVKFGVLSETSELHWLLGPKLNNPHTRCEPVAKNEIGGFFVDRHHLSLNKGHQNGTGLTNNAIPVGQEDR